MSTVSDRAIRGMQRLNLLLDRLGSADVPLADTAVPGPASGPVGITQRSQQDALLAEIVSELAASSGSSAELNSQLSMLQGLGVQQLGENLLQVLMRGLPDWAAPVAPPADAPLPADRATRAMRQVVSLASDSDEARSRFEELVSGAVQQFNEGSLGRAVTVLDLAERMVEEGEIKGPMVESVLDGVAATIAEERLREAVNSRDNHVLLRRFLGFFPSYRVDELLVELEEADARDRRRFVLSLLGVHGAAARPAIVARLKNSLSGNHPSPWYMERNLVYLLRTLDRDPDADVQTETDLLVESSSLSGPLPLIREALTALGALATERSERSLAARVSELEDALTGRIQVPHDIADVLGLLDVAVPYLARSRNAVARRAALAHGLKRQGALGDTTARIVRLGRQDLSEDRELVNRILGEIQDELPKKVFGLAMKTGRKSRMIGHLVETLAGTDTPEVRAVLTRISNDFATESFGQVATRVLARLGTPDETEDRPEPSASLTGDLVVFGLPNLLQNLSDAYLSGTLSLIAEDGRPFAEIELASGMLKTARFANLEGPIAVYQLFERPYPGRFAFVQRDDEPREDADTDALFPVTPLLLEGMRRFDEFNVAVSVAPDEARFKPTPTRPTNPDEETDPQLVLQVWEMAAAGRAPVDCEGVIPVDSYQIRRLFEHWVTEGALLPVGD